MTIPVFACVLIVGGDDVQLRYLAWLFRRLGLPDVLEAGSVQAATEMLCCKGDVIDLVIADLYLRDGDGMDVAHQIALRGLTCAMAIASLHDGRMIAAAEMVARSLGIRVMPALLKPFEVDSIAEWLGATSKAFAYSCGEKSQPAGYFRGLTFNSERAFRDREICAFFQPQMDVRHGALHGFEALARWTPHPGYIAWPAHMFMDSLLAANSEAQLLAAVFRDVAHLCAVSPRTFSVSINVTARFLCEEGAIPLLLRLCDEQQLPASRIVIEITEAQGVDALSGPCLIAAGNRLRLCGFDLSVDDFGTGASSIERISVLPITELKMDRSLLRRAVLYPHARTILDGSIALAHRLGVRSVVEGIETPADLDIVRALGAECAQGRLFSMPISLKRACRWALGQQVQC